MTRDLPALASRSFDLVVVGGGIYGICAAREAALRGLAVCLLERGDFVGETSSNSLRIIHGGLRYLQHGDLRRMRESIGERRRLQRLAPALVRPLPCVMPTYGHGLMGKEALAVALAVNDLVGFDRNAGVAPE
jgi:glycerol-3-phosphate dehydrogenase